MSGRTVARETIMQIKVEQTPEGEPIDVFERDVRAGNGELLQCIPKEMHRNLGIGEESTLKITWYHNGFFVTTEDTDGSE